MKFTDQNIYYYLIENMPEKRKTLGFVNEYFRLIKKEFKENTKYEVHNDKNILKTKKTSNFGILQIHLSLEKPLNDKCSYLDERIENLNLFTFNQLKSL